MPVASVRGPAFAESRPSPAITSFRKISDTFHHGKMSVLKNHPSSWRKPRTGKRAGGIKPSLGKGSRHHPFATQKPNTIS
jgi:hypothetical protein